MEAKNITVGITVTAHCASEWSRMARAAYAADRNDVGHRYSMASACLQGSVLPARVYDALQSPYRAWLVFNELPSHAAIAEQGKVYACGIRKGGL